MWHFDTCHVRFGSLPHPLPVYRLAAEGASHWKSQVTQTHWNHKIQQSIKLFLHIRPVLSAAEKHIQTVFYPDTNSCKRNGYLIFGKGNFYHQKAKRTKRQILDTPVGHKWVFWWWSFLLNLLKDFYNFQRTIKNLTCRCAYLTVYRSVSSLQPSNLPTGKRHTARIFEHMPWKLFSLLKKKLCICYARIQALILICLRKLKKRNETTLKLRRLVCKHQMNSHVSKLLTIRQAQYEKREENFSCR